MKIECQERLGLGFGPKSLHPIAQDGDAAAIAELAETLENLEAFQVGSDDRVKRRRLGPVLFVAKAIAPQKFDFLTFEEFSWLLEAMKDDAERRALLLVAGEAGLRHAFCSHLAMRGAAPKAIEELADHSTLSMTLRYMHLAPSALREAIGLLDDFGQPVGSAEKAAV